jgi:hypothetical protein
MSVALIGLPGVVGRAKDLALWGFDSWCGDRRGGMQSAESDPPRRYGRTAPRWMKDLTLALTPCSCLEHQLREEGWDTAQLTEPPQATAVRSCP